MHMQPAYKKYNNKSFELNNSIIYLKESQYTIHPYLDNNQREYIIKALKDASKH